jgi:hypothetical protein
MTMFVVLASIVCWMGSRSRLFMSVTQTGEPMAMATGAALRASGKTSPEVPWKVVAAEKASYFTAEDTLNRFWPTNRVTLALHAAPVW